MDASLVGGRVLLPNGDVEPATVTVAEGDIAEIGSGARGAVVDVDGRLILPGIVDIHGDAFERQIMPRPGVQFGLDLALHDTDRQLLANGITTAFHGLTYSWEPGLRGRENFEALLAAIDRLRPALLCDTRLHLRFETHNLDAVDQVCDLLGVGEIGLLAFNDHVADTLATIAKPMKLAYYAGRAGLASEAFLALAESVRSRGDEVPDAVARLAEAARAAAVPMLSHDDPSPAVRAHYDALGCTIAEFPKTETTAEAARRLGNPVVMGAPNVVRGGSHNRMPSAADMVERGICSVLASDYYYPALLHAAFKLARDGRAPFGAGWGLISRNPAVAAGLDDRGEIAVGRRADLVIVDDTVPNFPRIVGVLVAGRLVYAIDPTLLAGAN